MDVLLRGKQDSILGNYPKKGEKAPDFKAVDLKGKERSLADYKGEIVLLNVFPDIETGVCSTQTARFNQMAEKLEGIKIVSISVNKKEELENWCAGKQIEMDILRDPDRIFGENYGILVKNADKLGRSVFVIDRNGEVVYEEVLRDMSQEPNYEKASAAAKQAAARIE